MEQELKEGMNLQLTPEEVEKLQALIAEKKYVNEINDLLKGIRDQMLVRYDKIGDELFNPLIERYGIDTSKWEPDVDEENLTIKLAGRKPLRHGDKIAAMLQGLFGDSVTVKNLGSFPDDDDTSIRVKE